MCVYVILLVVVGCRRTKNKNGLSRYLFRLLKIVRENCLFASSVNCKSKQKTIRNQRLLGERAWL